MMATETDHYSFNEVYDRIDEYYKYYKEFVYLLVKALCYLSRDDADDALDNAFFIPFDDGSWHFSKKLINERAVVIIDIKDLDIEEDAIITILHEVGHAVLGHENAFDYTEEEMIRTEDECWSQVRKWLPIEFHECIGRHERIGAGTVGMHAIAHTDKNDEDG